MEGQTSFRRQDIWTIQRNRVSERRSHFFSPSKVRRQSVKRPNVPKSHQLKRRDGDTDQDDVADVQGHVCGLVDGRELEACAEDAGEGEDDHEAPAGGFAEAMADREEDGDGECGQVEY